MLSKSDTKINFLIAFHTTHMARQSREVERTSGIIMNLKVIPIRGGSRYQRERWSIDAIYVSQEPRSVGCQAHNFSSEAGCCQLFSRNPGQRVA